MASLNNSEHDKRLEQYRRQISHLNSAPPKSEQPSSLFGAASSASMAHFVRQQAQKQRGTLSRVALLAMLNLCQWDVMDLNEQDYSHHF